MGSVLRRGIILFIPIFLMSQESWIYRLSDGYSTSIISGMDGNIYSAGSYMGDIVVVSLDTAGQERWIYTYNGPGNGNDRANAIIYGSDNNLYIAGYSTGDTTGYDFTVISLDTAGQERWVYRYTTPLQGSDIAQSIVYGDDGNIYVAGHFSDSTDPSGGHFAVMSLTDTGTLRWTYIPPELLGSDLNMAQSLTYGGDGNIYVCGSIMFHTTVTEFIVLSLTPDGQLRWYNLHSPGYTHAKAYAITYGQDGNIYSTGYIDEISNKGLAVKSLDTLGAVRWTYLYTGSLGGGTGYSLTTDPQENIYIAGWEKFSGSYNDIIVISLDTLGQEMWVYTYDGPGNGFDGAYSIVYGSDGNLYIAGYSEDSSLSTDFTVISLDTAGQERWVYRYTPYPESILEASFSLVYSPNNNIYASGYISDSNNTTNGFGIISLPANFVKTEEQYTEKNSLLDFISVPSFFNGKIIINSGKVVHSKSLKISIYNLTGRNIFSKEYFNPSYPLIIEKWKDEKIPSGIYFLNITLNKKNTETFKLVKP